MIWFSLLLQSLSPVPRPKVFSLPNIEEVKFLTVYIEGIYLGIDRDKIDFITCFIFSIGKYLKGEHKQSLMVLLSNQTQCFTRSWIQFIATKKNKCFFFRNFTKNQNIQIK